MHLGDLGSLLFRVISYHRIAFQGKPSYEKHAFSKVWNSNQQQQQHRETCRNVNTQLYLRPTESETLDRIQQTLCFNKPCR